MAAITADDVINFWGSPDWVSGPYVHPADRKAFYGSPHHEKHVVGMLPIPYQGNLSKADIFVVWNNPQEDPQNFLKGMWPSKIYPNADLFEMDHAFRLCELQQEEPALDGPCYWQDWLAWHEGHKYARRVFGRLFGERLRRRICILNPMAYGSETFNRIFAERLPSFGLMRRYVKENLYPRAEAGEILLIVSRNVAGYGFDEKPESASFLRSQRLATGQYQISEVMNRAFTPNGRFGKAIGAWLNKR